MFLPSLTFVFPCADKSFHVFEIILNTETLYIYKFAEILSSYEIVL
jgi:hypothetical protein